HKSLRFKARREGGRMVVYFHQSREAFIGNDKRLAKEFSLKGEAHKETWCFSIRKPARRYFKIHPNTVNLQGLYVTEAKFYFERTVEKVRNRAQSLYVIVGKGNHSDDNIPKIKPAIQALGERYVLVS
ncbi:hypothetical protein K503DRAFT_671266, partial [Rhizopogon vinicolor AM-OR11-026]